MTWTRKDFQYLAGVMHRSRTALMRTGDSHVLAQFDVMFLPLVCEELAEANPRFDSERFTQAVVTGKETT